MTQGIVQKTALYLMAALAWCCLVMQVGCRAPWPACQKDEECTQSDPRNKTGQRYFCLQGRCQMCRTAADCRDPKRPKCKGYRCMPPTCEDITCPARKRCNPKNLACEWICNKDGESPCDGDRCKFCKGHQCLYTAPKCASSEDCPGMQVCRHPATCNAHCTTGCDPLKCKEPYECYHATCMLLCEFSPLLFARNTFTVNKRYDSYLQRVKACLSKRPDKKLLLMGHNDEWKFWEYNVHLSLRRARAVRARMIRLGVNAARLCTAGLGNLDPKRPTPKAKSSFPENRRVTFKLLDQCP